MMGHWSDMCSAELYTKTACNTRRTLCVSISMFSHMLWKLLVLFLSSKYPTEKLVHDMCVNSVVKYFQLVVAMGWQSISNEFQRGLF